jgi:hypothetical protein
VPYMKIMYLNEIYLMVLSDQTKDILRKIALCMDPESGTSAIRNRNTMSSGLVCSYLLEDPRVMNDSSGSYK